MILSIHQWGSTPNIALPDGIVCKYNRSQHKWFIDFFSIILSFSILYPSSFFFSPYLYLFFFLWSLVATWRNFRIRCSYICLGMVLYFSSFSFDCFVCSGIFKLCFFSLVIDLYNSIIFACSYCCWYICF